MKIDLLAVSDNTYPAFKGKVLEHYSEELVKMGWDKGSALTYSLNNLNRNTVYEVYVVETSGQPPEIKEYSHAGWIDVQLFDELVFFRYIYILEEFRGKGIGTALFEDFKKRYPNRKLWSFFFLCNTPSIVMHRKAGTKVIGNFVEL